MASAADVISAINTMATRISDAIAARSSFHGAPVTGSITLAGDRPTVTLSTSIDPKDLVRVGMTMTVNEAGTQRVFVIDEFCAVAADGKTVKCQPLSRALNSARGGSTPVYYAWYTGEGSWQGYTVNDSSVNIPAVAVTTFTLVSSSLTMLTRYHES